jgi:UPF0716 protein FxsA
MAKWFLVAVVIFVVAEWAAFLAVSAVIGLMPAFVLLMATSLAGIAVLQYPGRTRIQRLHQAVTKDGLGGLQAGGDAFLTVAAGFLLLVPGFITDAAGLILLVPPVRRWVGGRFRLFVATRPASPGVVDLEREEWNRVPEQKLGRPPRPDDRP